MVAQWGFSDKLGPILYSEDEGRSVSRSGQNGEGLNICLMKPHILLTEEVRAIVSRNYQEQDKFLIDNMDILHAMKDALVKYETIEEDQIRQLIDREPVVAPAGWTNNGKKIYL